MNAAPVRRRLRISGRVQGVGFRYFTLAAARRLSLDGWVANLPDGDVLCEVQGEPGVVEALIDQLRHGPRLSRVSGVAVESIEPLPGTAGFAIR